MLKTKNFRFLFLLFKNIFFKQIRKYLLYIKQNVDNVRTRLFLKWFLVGLRRICNTQSYNPTHSGFLCEQFILNI